MGNCKDNCLKHFISCKYYDSTCLSLLLVLKKYNMLKKKKERDRELETGWENHAPCQLVT